MAHIMEARAKPANILGMIGLGAYTKAVKGEIVVRCGCENDYKVVERFSSYGGYTRQSECPSCGERNYIKFNYSKQSAWGVVTKTLEVEIAQ